MVPVVRLAVSVLVVLAACESQSSRPRPERDTAAPAVAPSTPPSPPNDPSWKPDPTEPVAVATFDPYECEQRTHVAMGRTNVGIHVIGPEGDDCVFQLDRYDAMDPKPLISIARCTIKRSAAIQTIPWGLPKLEIAGATCAIRSGLSTDDWFRERAHFAGSRSVRFWDPPNSQLVELRKVPQFEISYRVWPPSVRRPALETLDPTALEVHKTSINTTQSSMPEPWGSAIRSEKTRPRRFRFSVPIAEAGVLLGAVPNLPSGRYIAAEIEVTSLAQPPPEKPTTGPITFDAQACVAGDGGHRSLGMGSVSAIVVGPDGASCVYTGMREVEGGYSRSECRVPRATGAVSIVSGDLPGKFPGDCKLLKSGSVFQDMANIKYVTSALIPGTRYALKYYTLASGSGAALARGETVSVQVSAWGPTATAMDTTVAFTGQPTASKKLSLELGKATYGKALDTALLEPGLQRGGKRQLGFRTEVVGAFTSVLGDIKLAPEQWIFVAVEVLE